MQLSYSTDDVIYTSQSATNREDDMNVESQIAVIGKQLLATYPRQCTRPRRSQMAIEIFALPIAAADSFHRRSPEAAVTVLRYGQRKAMTSSECNGWSRWRDLSIACITLSPLSEECKRLGKVRSYTEEDSFV